MYLHVIWKKFTYVSVEHTASIFWVEEYAKKLAASKANCIPKFEHIRSVKRLRIKGNKGKSNECWQ
jgi:hypothetical protein